MLHLLLESPSDSLLKNARAFLIEQDNAASSASKGERLASTLFRYPVSDPPSDAAS